MTATKYVASNTMTSHQWQPSVFLNGDIAEKEGTIPAAFRVTESTVTSKGVIIVNYERAGAFPTGSS